MAPIRKPIVLLAVWGVLGAFPASSPAAAARERLIAVTPASTYPATLTSDRGYIAWVQVAGKGKRRIVVRRPDGTRRSLLVKGDVQVALRHAVDQRSGREVLRLITARRHRHTGEVVTSHRSPRTLRRIQTDWAPFSATTVIDAGRTVTATTAVSQPTPADVKPSPSATTSCEFTGSVGLPALPRLSDCSPGTVWLFGAQLISTSIVPSGTIDAGKGSTTTRALDVFALDDPQAGWRRLATSYRDYDGSSGLQSYCATAEGVALVEGEERALRDRPVATWKLRWVPADLSKEGWTAELPQLDAMANHDGPSIGLACVGSSIYAMYRVPSKTDSLGFGANRFVRFLPPGMS